MVNNGIRTYVPFNNYVRLGVMGAVPTMAGKYIYPKSVRISPDTTTSCGGSMGCFINQWGVCECNY